MQYGVREILGEKCVHILEKQGIVIDNVIDNDPELENQYISNVKVKFAENYFLDKNDSQIILAGRRWKEMLKEINHI